MSLDDLISLPMARTETETETETVGAAAAAGIVSNTSSEHRSCTNAKVSHHNYFLPVHLFAVFVWFISSFVSCLRFLLHSAFHLSRDLSPENVMLNRISPGSDWIIGRLVMSSCLILAHACMLAIIVID